MNNTVKMWFNTRVSASGYNFFGGIDPQPLKPGMNTFLYKKGVDAYSVIYLLLTESALLSTEAHVFMDPDYRTSYCFSEVFSRLYLPGNRYKNFSLVNDDFNVHMFTYDISNLNIFNYTTPYDKFNTFIANDLSFDEQIEWFELIKGEYDYCKAVHSPYQRTQEIDENKNIISFHSHDHSFDDPDILYDFWGIDTKKVQEMLIAEMNRQLTNLDMAVTRLESEGVNCYNS